MKKEQLFFILLFNFKTLGNMDSELMLIASSRLKLIEQLLEHIASTWCIDRHRNTHSILISYNFCTNMCCVLQSRYYLAYSESNARLTALYNLPSFHVDYIYIKCALNISFDLSIKEKGD